MAHSRAEARRTPTHIHTEPLGEVSMKWSAVKRPPNPKRKPVCNPLIKSPTYCTNIVIKPKSTPAKTATPRNNFGCSQKSIKRSNPFIHIC